MNESIDCAINQISSSSVEWWSSFVCSSRLDLFYRRRPRAMHRRPLEGGCWTGVEGINACGRFALVRSSCASCVCSSIGLDAMARCNHGPRAGAFAGLRVLLFWSQNLPECVKKVIEMRQEIFKMKPASRLGGILGRFWADVGSEKAPRGARMKSRTVFGLPFGVENPSKWNHRRPHFCGQGFECIGKAIQNEI